MFHGLQHQVGEGLLDRVTLLVNHLLSSEPVARHRLATHAGRTLELRLQGLPAPLPALPASRFRVTPAGLFERSDAELSAVEPDLRVEVDASNPARAALQALAGRRPRIDISGDAAFAADLNWLFDNLRWDAEDDLARVLGPMPARQIARVGGGVATALREAARTFGALAERR